VCSFHCSCLLVLSWIIISNRLAVGGVCFALEFDCGRVFPWRVSGRGGIGTEPDVSRPVPWRVAVAAQPKLLSRWKNSFLALLFSSASYHSSLSYHSSPSSSLSSFLSSSYSSSSFSYSSFFWHVTCTFPTFPHLPPPSPVTPPPCVFFIWMRANGPRRGWRNICLPSSVFGYKFFQPMGWLASPKTNPKRKTPKKSRAKLIMNLTRSLAKCMAMRWKPRDWLNQSLGAELRVEGRGNLNGLVCDSKTRST